MEDWRKGPSEETLMEAWRYLAECAWERAVECYPDPPEPERSVPPEISRLDEELLRLEEKAPRLDPDPPTHA